MSVEDTKQDLISDPVPPYTVADQVDDDVSHVQFRPPIVYTSPSAFFSSLWARWKSLWTPRFIFSMIAGQVVSLCITVTNVTTTELVNRNWSLPTTQTWFLYFSLFAVYTPYTIYQYGFKGWAKMIWRDGWKCTPDFILACCDVEGNFLVVKAYNYTDLLSCMLLDAWAMRPPSPSCVAFLVWTWLGTLPLTARSVQGVLICVGGLGMLLASDMLTDKNYPALNKGKGDAFMIIGATLYGFTNATGEFFVRRSPLYKVIGQLGMWGTLINGIQASALEHHDMTLASWNGATGGFLVAYTAGK
ncbi:hypothetical protein PISMIDRAFT_122236 [Pisolithus microcarpus 441]|uniref:Uncharacterized protein n=1 Tax=Pisolithus microcarpus 441 TaxID=765257 RepID=A0A0C9YD13_9AGAM|nr:hypothetical protein PISMIDRAFT_122236 [Pisolithus microcarpus 441]